MNVVTVHNFYQQPGGEDQVFDAEARLLEAHGHSVTRYTAHNDQISKTHRASLPKDTIWNSEQYKRLRSLLRNLRPDVVHVHNTLPLISPAVYYAAKAEGAAVVQTLHNYRLSCVNGLFYRDGHVCEDCLGATIGWSGVVHACYRNSRAASAVVTAMLSYHRLRGTYYKQVDRYIALTEFSRQKFIEMGLPVEKLVVKPNFVAPDPGPGTGTGSFAMYVGRLTEEKGVRSLLSAWQSNRTTIPLKVIGSGPLAQLAAEAGGVVEYLGHHPRQAVLELLKAASFLVFPSLWYETFGMSIIEAFAAGTPVIASRQGTPAALVDHGRTGLHFEPGSPADLAAKVRWLLDNPTELARMRVEARAEYEAKYTAEENYRQLIGIYEDAIRANRS